MSVSFDLHKLGWKAFEDLVACIFRDMMGQTFQPFADGVDGGRDGAFRGQWTPRGGENMSGTFVIQCKHTSKPGKAMPASVVEDELPKVARLAAEGLADNYILVTNHALPAEAAKDAEAVFEKAGAGRAVVYGPEWIAQTIAERPALRRLVPRLYGLGDLTQIVTHQAYRQAREVLEALAPDLDRFVPTEAYRKCAHALKEHGFVLLLGEPASGKTMIANLMALSAADEWGLQTLMLDGPEDFTRLWNPDDPGQFLWVDDAFGATQYDPLRVREWNQRLNKLKTAIHKGARVVFTSRDYVFRHAKNDLKVSAFELFDDSRVTIEVEGLTPLERQLILYNHLKCGAQPPEFRRAVKPYLEAAAATPKFLPEVARRFASPKFTKDLTLDQHGVRRFFKEPVRWLEDVLSGLAAAEKAAVALVFIAGGRLPIPVPEEDAVLRTIATMNSTIGEVKAALNALDDTLLRRAREEGREFWRFRHPTVRDAFAGLVGGNPELIDVYLAGVDTGRLMGEVTCGDMGIQGVKIIVPPERFGDVIAKLKAEAGKERESFFDPVGSFLASRCSAAFLFRYFSEVEPMAGLPGQVGYLESYNAPLRILSRMQADGLLPEDVRLLTAKRIRDLATESYSCKFMDEDIACLLSEDERRALYDEVKDIVLSNDYEIIRELRYGWDGESDPDDMFSTVRETLEMIWENENEKEGQKAQSFLSDISRAVDEMEERRPPSTGYRTLDAEKAAEDKGPMARSIFDDVDE